jgi:hypothetical protein
LVLHSYPESFARVEANCKAIDEWGSGAKTWIVLCSKTQRYWAPKQVTQ